MKRLKTIGLVLAAVLCAGVADARPGPGPRVGGPRIRHHGGSFWGRGGRNFWPGFVGGVVGGVLVDAVVGPSYYYSSPAPVVVTQPVVTTPVVVQQPVVQQTVWVEGRYVDQVKADGTVIRVWQPGHYETLPVVR